MAFRALPRVLFLRVQGLPYGFWGPFCSILLVGFFKDCFMACLGPFSGCFFRVLFRVFKGYILQGF